MNSTVSTARRGAGSRKRGKQADRIGRVLSAVEQRVANGSTVPDACRELGVTTPTYYRWRRNAQAAPQEESLASAAAQHVLNTAESLCAEHGLEVSLRKIARVAGVSNATLSYHFKSRGDLLYRICARRVEQLDSGRYRLLDEAEERSNPPNLEDVIVAFFLPGLQATASPDPAMANYMRFLGRIAQDPAEDMQSIMARCYGNLHKRFMFAFSRALPEQSLEEVYWRYTAFTGVFVTMAQNPNRINRISSGLVNMTNPETAMQRLLPILMPMMRGRSESRPPGGISTLDEDLTAGRLGG